jgi:hypothetical protein
MKKLFVSLMLFAAALGWASTASAVVVAGSTYRIYLAGDQSGTAIAPVLTFDNQPEFVSRDGLALRFTESDTALDASSSRITLNVDANGDLFPAFNEGAFFGVGIFNDPLDLDRVQALYDASITLRDTRGNILYAFTDLADLAETNMPWDGSFPTQTTTINISDLGGQGIASIAFDFFVRDIPPVDVPEPASVLLCGFGLLAIVAARRGGHSRA